MPSRPSPAGVAEDSAPDDRVSYARKLVTAARGSASDSTGHLAALRAADKKPGGVDPDPLPEGHLDRRLRRGASGAGRQECARSFGLDNCPPQGGVDRGARALAEARSLHEAL